MTLDGAAAGQSKLAVRLADGAGGFAPVVTFDAPDGPFDLAVGDLNGDTHADVVTVQSGRGDGIFPSGLNNTVSLLLGNGAGSFAPRTDYVNLARGMTSVATGDVDGDGDLDVVTANFGNTFSARAIRLRCCLAVATAACIPTKVTSLGPIRIRGEWLWGTWTATAIWMLLRPTLRTESILSVCCGERAKQLWKFSIRLGQC